MPEALASLLTLTFLAMLIRTAWLSDDALITLRSVLNVTHGFGLRFNIDERVQTYTHPRWLAILTAASCNGLSLNRSPIRSTARSNAARTVRLGSGVNCA